MSCSSVVLSAALRYKIGVTMEMRASIAIASTIRLPSSFSFANLLFNIVFLLISA